MKHHTILMGEPTTFPVSKIASKHAYLSNSCCVPWQEKLPYHWIRQGHWRGSKNVPSSTATKATTLNCDVAFTIRFTVSETEHLAVSTLSELLSKIKQGAMTEVLTWSYNIPARPSNPTITAWFLYQAAVLMFKDYQKPRIDFRDASSFSSIFIPSNQKPPTKSTCSSVRPLAPAACKKGP